METLTFQDEAHKRRALLSKGFDPDKFDVDLTTGNINLKIAQQASTSTPPVETALAVAPVAAKPPSMLQSGLTGAATSALPSLGGVAAIGALQAPILAASAMTGPAAPITAIALNIAAMLAGSSTVSGLQSMLMPDSWQQKIDEAQTANPMSFTGGTFAGAMPVMGLPNPLNVLRAGRTVGKLGSNLIKPTTQAISPSAAEISNLGNVAIGGALPAGMALGENLVFDRPIDPKQLLLESVGGLLLNNPTALGSKLMRQPHNAGVDVNKLTPEQLKASSASAGGSDVLSEVGKQMEINQAKDEISKGIIPPGYKVKLDVGTGKKVAPLDAIEQNILSPEIRAKAVDKAGNQKNESWMEFKKDAEGNYVVDAEGKPVQERVYGQKLYKQQLPTEGPLKKLGEKQDVIIKGEHNNAEEIARDVFNDGNTPGIRAMDRMAAGDAPKGETYDKTGPESLGLDKPSELVSREAIKEARDKSYAEYKKMRDAKDIPGAMAFDQKATNKRMDFGKRYEAERAIAKLEKTYDTTLDEIIRAKLKAEVDKIQAANVKNFKVGTDAEMTAAQAAHDAKLRTNAKQFQGIDSGGATTLSAEQRLKAAAEKAGNSDKLKKPTKSFYDLFVKHFGPLRGEKSKLNQRLTNAEGKSVRGAEGDWLAEINPNTATVDTVGHEHLHGFIRSLRESANPNERASIENLIKTVENHPEFAADNQRRVDAGQKPLSAEEFMTETTGYEIFNRMVNADGFRGSLKSGWRDFVGQIKSKLGKSSIEDVNNYLANKFINDPHINESRSKGRYNPLTGKVEHGNLNTYGKTEGPETDSGDDTEVTNPRINETNREESTPSVKANEQEKLSTNPDSASGVTTDNRPKKPWNPDSPRYGDGDKNYQGEDADMTPLEKFHKSFQDKIKKKSEEALSSFKQSELKIGDFVYDNKSGNPIEVTGAAIPTKDGRHKFHGKFQDGSEGHVFVDKISIDPPEHLDKDTVYKNYQGEDALDHKFSPKLEADLKYLLKDVDREEPYSRNQAIKDTIDDLDDTGHWANDHKKELEDFQIKTGIVKGYTKAQINEIQTMGRGKKYDFRRGDIYYKFESWEPLEGTKNYQREEGAKADDKNADFRRYSELEKKQKELFNPEDPMGSTSTEEFKSLQKEREDIKNRHGKMPPKEDKNYQEIDDAGKESVFIPDTLKLLRDPSYLAQASDAKMLSTQSFEKRLKARVSKDELDLLNSVGFDKFIKSQGERINIAKTTQWIKDNAPKVEIKSYGMEGKVSEAKKEYDAMTHEWLETLPQKAQSQVQGILNNRNHPDIQSKIMDELLRENPNVVEAHVNNYMKLDTQMADEYRAGRKGTSLRATSHYESVSAFSTKEPMPKWTKTKSGKNVQRVDVVLPNKHESKIQQLETESQSATPLRKQAIRNEIDNLKADPETTTKWTQDKLHENLPNTLGWAMIQYKTGPKGEKIAVIAEAQSRWGQEKRKYETIYNKAKKDGKYEDVARQMAEDAVQQYRPGMDSPLDKDYNRLILKAAIDQARKEGATHIMLSDAESAMMTEGHDLHTYDLSIIEPTEHNIQAAIALRNNKDGYSNFNNGMNNYALDSLINNNSRAEFSGDTNVKNHLRDLGFILETKNQIISQESGMRLNYDTILPKIAEDLTGNKGEKISLGEHKNALVSDKGVQGLNEPVHHKNTYDSYDAAFDAMKSIQGEKARFAGGNMHGKLPFGLQVTSGHADGKYKVSMFPDSYKQYKDIANEAGFNRASDYRSNLIFKNPDGTPKTDVSGTLFPIDKIAARQATGEEMSYFGKKYQEIDNPQLNTPEFKNWFGESKVVDGEGKPLIVEHQTSNPNFTVFNRKQGSEQFGRDLQAPERIGSWFTVMKDKDGGKAYGEHSMKVYLRINNPKEIFSSIGDKVRIDNSKVLFNEIKKAGGADAFRAKLIKEGNDGVVLKNTYLDGLKQDVYIALEPTQIKSATGNNGKFDPKNPDIRYQESDEPPANDLDFRPKPQAKTYVESRKTLEETLNSPEFKKQGVIRQNLRSMDKRLPVFGSELDKLATRGGEAGKYIAPHIKEALNKYDEFIGRWLNPTLATLKSHSIDDQNLIVGTMREENRRQVNLRDELPTEKLKESYDKIRQLLVDKQQNQIEANQPVDSYVKGKLGGFKTIPRLPRINKFYFPDIAGAKQLDIILNSEGSKAFDILKRDFINHIKEQYKFDDAAAEQFFQDYRGSYSGNQGSGSRKFGAVNKAEGIGLPDSWLEPDAKVTMRRYWSRVSKARSWYDAVEKDHNNLHILNKSRDAWDEKVTPTVEGLGRGNQVLTDIIDTINGTNIKTNPKLDATVRIANNLLMGFATGVNDVISAMPVASKYLPSMFDSPAAMGYAIKNLKRSIQHATETGRIKDKISDMQEIVNPSTDVVEKLRESADFVAKVTGREGLEKFSRGLSQGINEYAVQMHKKLAELGDKKSIALLEDIANTSDWKTMDLKQLASRLVDRSQGTYDVRGLPNWVINSQVSPLFRMMKWNIEQLNNLHKDVVMPATRGNLTPLITTMVTGIAGGYIAKEVREAINHKEFNGPNLDEIYKSKGSVGDKLHGSTYAVAAAISYSGVMGYLGEMMKIGMDISYKNKPHGLNFPTVEVISDMADNISDAIQAITQEGENPATVFPELAKRLLTNNIQVGRIASNWLQDKDTHNETRQRRDLRVYKQQAGDSYQGQTSTSNVNPYIGLETKKFQKMDDIKEIIPESRRLVKQTFEENKGNPVELKSKMAKLKAGAVTTFPSVDSAPAEFKKYYNYLVDLHGPEEASKRMKEYFQKKNINNVRKSLIPTIR